MISWLGLGLDLGAPRASTTVLFSALRLFCPPVLTQPGRHLVDISVVARCWVGVPGCDDNYVWQFRT